MVSIYAGIDTRIASWNLACSFSKCASFICDEMYRGSILSIECFKTASASAGLPFSCRVTAKLSSMMRSFDPILSADENSVRLLVQS